MAQYSLATATSMFKINYYKPSERLYNTADPLSGRLINKNDFTGRSRNLPTYKSYSGGVGSGSKPVGNVASYEEATLLRKKVYGTCEVDREAIKASENSSGAFVKATKEQVMKTVESYNRNKLRIILGNGGHATAARDSLLANGDGSTQVSGAGSTGSPYIVVCGADFKEANFEEKDFINYNAETSLLEVVEVDAATKTIKLVGTSTGLAALAGSGPMLTTVYFYMQGSKGNDPIGFKAISDLVNGQTLYGVTVDRKWKMQVNDASGQGIIVDALNELLLQIEKKTGKVPNMIQCSYTQYVKILNLLEDQKTYNLPARDSRFKAMVSFSGIEFMSTKGPIPLFYNRFVEEDRIYAFNDNYIEVHHAPGFGWFDDDGTIFMRKSNGDDAYEATYGGYWNMYAQPTFHGCIKNLAI
jgi:hypothetical protein